MRLIIIIGILLSGVSFAESEPRRITTLISTSLSPDKDYSAVLEKRGYERGYKYFSIVIKKGDKQLFSETSTYGGYSEVFWSADSKYLAVVERSTKTSGHVKVFFIKHGEVKVRSLPDYTLNILGRFKKVKGGRYEFDKSLIWKKDSTLQFVTEGSFNDDCSNPGDFPDNWYRYKVVIQFSSDRADLVQVERMKIKPTIPLK